MIASIPTCVCTHTARQAQDTHTYSTCTLAGMSWEGSADGKLGALGVRGRLCAMGDG